ncbi:hypothetical protein [Methanolobus vulcani]|uniref:Lipoprotein n=1 Tax=Methanolobus vulcani TaxID=38026 RepID=A0A7Z8P1F2_9EURY|nr:hypothetical protein [Methanolobus vulcani]TQD23542.1 hypothetical protein FKV42_13545 [Methanolobus vulcani]
MKSIYVIIIVSLLILTTGCVSTNTPEETVTSFAYSASTGDSNTCYELMSSEYKNNTTLDDFATSIQDDGDSWYEYKFISVIEGSKKLNKNSAFLEVEYEKESISDDKSFGLTKLLGKALGQEYVFTKRIELINESDGWKIKDFHVELR